MPKRNKIGFVRCGQRILRDRLRNNTRSIVRSLLVSLYRCKLTSPYQGEIFAHDVKQYSTQPPSTKYRWNVWSPSIVWTILTPVQAGIRPQKSHRWDILIATGPLPKEWSVVYDSAGTRSGLLNLLLTLVFLNWYSTEIWSRWWRTRFERLPRIWKVGCSNPNRDRPKS